MKRTIRLSEPYRWCNGERAVDRGFESRMSWTEDYIIGICCFLAKDAA